MDGTFLRLPPSFPSPPTRDADLSFSLKIQGKTTGYHPTRMAVYTYQNKNQPNGKG